MSAAEDGVVDLFKDSVEGSRGCVSVLRHTVHLYGFGARGLIGIVHLLKKLWQHHIVAIEDDGYIIDFKLRKIVDCILE